jgi:hypothetical protein
MSKMPLGILAALIAACAITHSVAQSRELTFDDRIAAQEAIERVYYSHQIGATEPFEEAMPRAVLRQKVETYMKQSAALEEYWNSPVTAVMLRRELERMARETRMPERLRELFEALDNDPVLIQECLARSTLAGRLSRNFYDFDRRLHAAQKSQADQLREALASRRIDPWHEHELRRVVELEPSDFERWRNRMPNAPGEVPAVDESREAYSISVVLEEDESRVHFATYRVDKTPWHEWWESVSSDLDETSIGTVASADAPISSELGNPEDSTEEGDRAPCATDDTWDNGTLDDLPEARTFHSAVWTGSLMVVWGGLQSYIHAPSHYTYLDSGGRYDPATDS